MTCQPTSSATAPNAASPTTAAAAPDNGTCVKLTLWKVKPRLATVYPPELSPPALAEQCGAGREPEPQSEPDPRQSQPSRPRCTPYTRNTSSAAFSTLAVTAIWSGVRVSASPMRCPLPA